MDDLSLSDLTDQNYTMEGHKDGTNTKLWISFDGVDSAAVAINLTADQVVKLIQWLKADG